MWKPFAKSNEFLEVYGGKTLTSGMLFLGTILNSCLQIPGIYNDGHMRKGTLLEYAWISNMPGFQRLMAHYCVSYADVFRNCISTAILKDYYSFKFH